MTFRTAYELLLIGLGVIVAWKFIVKPLYTLVTRKSLVTTVDTSAEDELQQATRNVVDARVRDRAAALRDEALSLREKRTKPEEKK